MIRLDQISGRLVEFGSIILAVLVSGCISTTTLKPEELEQSTSRDIVVTTLDGKQISFNGGGYAVIRADTQEIIRGNGKLVPKGVEAEPTSFSGDIPFNSVASVETRKRTAFYYAGPIVIIALVGAYFVLHGNIKQ